MGLQAVLGGTVAWHCEKDPGAARILAHHWPDIPNHGDLTTTDWASVEPVDVITAGFPCQDLSYAGKGAGITEGTRSGLWYAVADAVGVLRPRLLVLENVAAIVGRRPGLDVVLGSLAALGFDAWWVCLRAADVGAPHGRDRWFLAAADTDDRGPRAFRARTNGQRRPYDGVRPLAATDAARDGRDQGWTEPARVERGPDAGVGCERGSGVERAGWNATERGETSGHPRDVAGAPAADTDLGRREGVRRLEPGRRDPDGRSGADIAWGTYEPAIRRWERLTRPAPAPTEPGARGAHRLSPVFVEWLMGLPAGWVTDPDIGLTRTQQLKALGNGVVPQQAAAALTHLLQHLEEAA